MRKTVFYLGTNYESTRVKGDRLDKLLEEPPVIEDKEVCYIDPELLGDQKRFIEIMEVPRKNQESWNKT